MAEISVSKTLSCVTRENPGNNHPSGRDSKEGRLTLKEALCRI